VVAHVATSSPQKVPNERAALCEKVSPEMKDHSPQAEADSKIRLLQDLAIVPSNIRSQSPTSDPVVAGEQTDSSHVLQLQ
jgi:hypothetical protein